jgi:hypothetical protein
MGGIGSGRKPGSRAAHRKADHPEYRVWQSMIARCEQPKAPGYSSAGERGAKVCARWRTSFETFLSDLGARPRKGYVLVRRNNEGDFRPGRVRWGLPAEVAAQRVERAAV